MDQRIDVRTVEGEPSNNRPEGHMQEPVDLFTVRIAKAISSGEVDDLVRARAEMLGMEMGRCCHGRRIDVQCKRCDEMTAESQ